MIKSAGNLSLRESHLLCVIAICLISGNKYLIYASDGEISNDFIQQWNKLVTRTGFPEAA